MVSKELNVENQGTENPNGKLQGMNREHCPRVCQRKSQGKTLASKAWTPVTEPAVLFHWPLRQRPERHVCVMSTIHAKLNAADARLNNKNVLNRKKK